jgi:hypothetical protein
MVCKKFRKLRTFNLNFGHQLSLEAHGENFSTLSSKKTHECQSAPIFESFSNMQKGYKKPIAQKKESLDLYVKIQYLNLIAENGQINFLTRNIRDFDLKSYRVKNIRSAMKFQNKYNQKLKINLILLNYIYSLNSCDLSWNLGREKIKKQTKFSKLICALIRSKSLNEMFVNYSELSYKKTKKVNLNPLVKKQYLYLISQNEQLNFLNKNINKFSLQNYRVKTLRLAMKFKNKYNQRLKLNLILLQYIYSLNCDDLHIGFGLKENKNLINNSIVQYIYTPEIFTESEFAALEAIKFKAQKKAAKNKLQQTAVKAWENFRNLEAANQFPDPFECQYDWSWSGEPIIITPLESVLKKPLTKAEIALISINFSRRNWRNAMWSCEDNYVSLYYRYLLSALKGTLTDQDFRDLQKIKDNTLIREQKERDQTAEAERLMLLNNEFWLD